MKKLLLVLALTLLATGASAQAQYQINPGNINVAASQATVTSTAAAVVSSRAGRSLLVLVNLGTVAVYCGPSTVTTANGLLLPGILGASISLPYQGALYCVTASTSQAISIGETY